MEATLLGLMEVTLVTNCGQLRGDRSGVVQGARLSPTSAYRLNQGGIGRQLQPLLSLYPLPSAVQCSLLHYSHVH